MNATIDKQLQALFDASKHPEDFMMDIYFLWCEINVGKRNLQKGLISQSISKWFVVEIKKHIDEYNLMAENYPNRSDAENLKLFFLAIAKIFDNYPKALIDAIKSTNKQNVFTTISLN